MFKNEWTNTAYDFKLVDDNDNLILYSDTSKQRIGIGTDTPCAPLEVTKEQGYPQLAISSYTSSGWVPACSETHRPQGSPTTAS